MKITKEYRGQNKVQKKTEANQSNIKNSLDLSRLQKKESEEKREVNMNKQKIDFTVSNTLRSLIFCYIISSGNQNICKIK